ncbi:MAG: flagellar hook-basal body complex protein FliE [Planctomycetota bacterium]
MIDALGPVGPMKGPAAAAPGRPLGAPGERSFEEILKDSLERLGRLQQEADRVLERYSAGEVTAEQVAGALQKSRMAFEALMEIRNELVRAFREIQGMQI